LLPEERKFTAYEANGRLYQFKRIPFGLKNAVACIQRVIDDIIAAYDCKGTFAYLDDIAVCGKTKEEHDKNLKTFLKAVRECIWGAVCKNIISDRFNTKSVISAHI